MDSKQPCPCGSGKSYADCCQPYHRNEAVANTAEQLMRSRYTAFVLKNSDYLLRTWDPQTRPESIEFEANLVWIGLNINGRKQGRKKDQQGWVTFVASYEMQPNPLEMNPQSESGQLHETSFFRRDEQGNWLYVEGELK